MSVKQGQIFNKSQLFIVLNFGEKGLMSKKSCAMTSCADLKVIRLLACFEPHKI